MPEKYVEDVSYPEKYAEAVSHIKKAEDALKTIKSYTEKENAEKTTNILSQIANYVMDAIAEAGLSSYFYYELYPNMSLSCIDGVCKLYVRGKTSYAKYPVFCVSNDSGIKYYPTNHADIPSLIHYWKNFKEGLNDSIKRSVENRKAHIEKELERIAEEQRIFASFEL